ncbi:MAG: lamin tail domain-containing protein [bacterium]|nr:lamin tail domain-containing protein [bacterium]
MYILKVVLDKLEQYMGVEINMKIIAYIVGLALVSPYFALASNDHLVIDQIQVSGNNGANDEYVQIFNPTTSAISLSGWSIQYKSGSADFPLTSGKKNLPETTVTAGGYFLIARSDYNGAVPADHVHSSFSLSASSKGATVFLVNDNQFVESGVDPNIVDKLAYGDSEKNSPEGASAPLPESEKVLLRIGEDTDNNTADFSISDPDPRNSSFVPETSAPTPPLIPPHQGEGEESEPYSSSVIISEFMPNPDGIDNGEEWVEIFSSAEDSVDLDGWILDDDSETGEIGSSAFTLENLSIQPQSYLAVDLPEGSFALNNSGGDTVRLFRPDGKLADSVVYTGNASSDETYARKDDGSYTWTSIVTKGSPNKFPVSVPESTEPTSKEKSETEQSRVTYKEVEFNEIFPNPSGQDSGSEWVEVINTGTETIDLHDWILDDGEVGDKIGSSAYQIQSPVIRPGGVAIIIIPAGKFALNNTGKETVRLFWPDKTLIHSVSYEDAVQDMSYSQTDDGTWKWTTPTPEEPNTFESEEASFDPTKILINEIFPEPEIGHEEFIELKNTGDKTADLNGWILADNASEYTIKDLSLEPGEIGFVIKSVSKIALNNSGQETVRLVDTDGKIMQEIEYEDAPKNKSYNLTESGEFLWSTAITPGEENQIEGGGNVRGAGLPVTGLKFNFDLMGFVILGIFCYSVGSKDKINPAHS